jgi:hypothetical protein
MWVTAATGRSAPHQATGATPAPEVALGTRREDDAMLEMLVLVLLVVGGLTALDVAAARIGIESRPPEHVDWTSPEPILRV